MRYRVAAVGRLRRSFYRQGCQFYLERLQAYGRAEVVEVKEGRGSSKEVRAAEGKALLTLTEGRLVVVDEHGESLRSTQLAKRLSQLELSGESSLTLLLGGAEGLSDEVKEKAAETWSLSALTLPHDLARLVLIEQLYRAETIRAGHPYHRE